MSENYELKSAESKSVAAPELPYRPPGPSSLRPKIGIIGCGGIVKHHLEAYRAAGWEIVAFYDRNPEKAEGYQKSLFPEASLCSTLEELLERPGLDVVDIATHPEERGPLIEKAIAAGKHTLSQKPFSLDLDEGRELASKALDSGVKLAVNLNGRWAPYFAYMRRAVQAGLIGKVSSVSITLNWDHTWTAGTKYERIPHLVLMDFGIHWIDAACEFFNDREAESVYACAVPSPEQKMPTPLSASATVRFPNGIASLHFNGGSRFGPQESCVVVGEKGVIRSVGGICGPQQVRIETEAGEARPALDGAWFNDGFRGTMGELLCAIEEGREAENNAFSALRSHAVCFAAMKSADTSTVVSL